MKNWPADRVERRPLATLIPNAKNARTHTPAQVTQIAESMREWGWTNPVLVDEGDGIIAGHGRVLAAAELGIADVPVMVAEGWTDAQKRAYALADNQLALNAGWDLDTLSEELRGLRDWDFDLSLLGFADLDALLARGQGLTDPDDAPPLPAVPISQPGDIWLLGRHRLVCGDCTDAETVAAALDGVRPHLMVTDPPYGVEYDPSWRQGVVKDRFDNTRATGKVPNDSRADWRDAWTLFCGDVAYVWHGAPQTAVVIDSLSAVDLVGRALIIWAKQNFVIGRGDYQNQHEPCWYAVRKGKPGHFCGGRSQSTLWQIKSQQGYESSRPNNVDKASGHGAQKPVECMKRPIENNSTPGQAVYDPFVGSGTTIIAAEMTGRVCHALEINPAYVDVSIKRWQAYTGEQAVSEAGQPFDERVPVPA